jgi:hypothetical protein
VVDSENAKKSDEEVDMFVEECIKSVGVEESSEMIDGDPPDVDKFESEMGAVLELLGADKQRRFIRGTVPWRDTILLLTLILPPDHLILDSNFLICQVPKEI